RTSRCLLWAKSGAAVYLFGRLFSFFFNVVRYTLKLSIYQLYCCCMFEFLKGIFIIEIKAQVPAVPLRPDLRLFAEPSLPEHNIVFKPTTLRHTRPFSFHKNCKALLF